MLESAPAWSCHTAVMNAWMALRRKMMGFPGCGGHVGHDVVAIHIFPAWWSRGKNGAPSLAQLKTNQTMPRSMQDASIMHPPGQE